METDFTKLSYEVTGAGSSHINGTYIYNAELTADMSADSAVFAVYKLEGSASTTLYGTYSAESCVWRISDMGDVLYASSPYPEKITPADTRSSWHALYGAYPVPTFTEHSTQPTEPEEPTTMSMNSMLLKAKMLLSDATIVLSQSATGSITFKVGAIAESQVTGLTTKLTNMQTAISALEAGTIDLSAYVAPAAISMAAATSFTIAATDAVAVTGSSFTYGGKQVVVVDDLTVYEQTANKNVANGYAGLNASLQIAGTQIPLDSTTLELKDGKLAVKTLPRVDNRVATGAVEGVPTIEGGATVEVGDIVAFKNDATSNAGEIYYRHSSSTGKLADDYTLMNFTFVANSDNITEGSTNKFLTAAEQTMVKKLSVTDDVLSVNGVAALNTVAVDTAIFSGDGKAAASKLGLVDGGIALTKLVQTGAIPAGWSVPAGQVTGLDAELNAVVKSATVTGPAALTASVTGTELTMALALSADITGEAGGLAINAGTGVGQFLKFATAATLPALNGAALTGLNATNLASGIVASARLPFAGQTSNAKGAVFVGSGVGLSCDDGDLQLEIVKEGTLSGTGHYDSPLTVNTEVIATKASVDAAVTRLDNLEQAAVAFTSTDLVDGVLTVSGKRIPKGICKSDYSNLLPVFPETMTAPDASGVSSFTLDLAGLSLVGNWLVVF